MSISLRRVVLIPIPGNAIARDFWRSRCYAVAECLWRFVKALIEEDPSAERVRYANRLIRGYYSFEHGQVDVELLLDIMQACRFAGCHKAAEFVGRYLTFEFAIAA